MMDFFMNEKTQNYFLGILYMIDALAFYMDNLFLMCSLTGIILIFQAISFIKIAKNSSEKNILQGKENKFSRLVYQAGLFLFAIATLIHAYQ